jgi:hypothetical protein
MRGAQKRLQKFTYAFEKIGDPDAIRTRDPQIRNIRVYDQGPSVCYLISAIGARNSEMTDLTNYRNTYLPVKYFLNSYRALSDGTSGIDHLEEHLRRTRFLLSDWKIIWTGVCAILRTSIDLFQVDWKSCINAELRKEIKHEWEEIKNNKEAHAIFWQFLRKERDNIAHEYAWTAYGAWMDKEGSIKQRTFSLLDIRPEDHQTVLLMKKGAYEGRDSVELLREGAEWAKERVFSAIRRAGLNPDEERNIMTFECRPLQTNLLPKSLLADM